MLPKHALYLLSYTEMILRLNSVRATHGKTVAWLTPCVRVLTQTPTPLPWLACWWSTKITRKTTQVIHEWSGHRGSNPGPRPWQGRALPTELCPHVVALTAPTSTEVVPRQIVKESRCKSCWTWCAARSLLNTVLFWGNKKARSFWSIRACLGQMARC